MLEKTALAFSLLLAAWGTVTAMSSSDGLSITPPLSVEAPSFAAKDGLEKVGDLNSKFGDLSKADLEKADLGISKLGI